VAFVTRLDGALHRAGRVTLGPVTERRDLEASLAEMDRKLRELQRELALVSGQGAPAEPAPAPPAAAERVAGVVEEAAARVSELGRRIDELARLRDDLDRATQALRSEYGAARARAAASREVVLDAGPFPDIATLSAFEQALARVDGVRDAVVRSFEGNRALVDVRVGPEVDLEEALPVQLPFEIDVARAQDGGLAVHLRSEA
jgi:hypothetical protein